MHLSKDKPCNFEQFTSIIKIQALLATRNFSRKLCHGYDAANSSIVAPKAIRISKLIVSVTGQSFHNVNID